MIAASSNIIPPLSPGSIQCLFDKSDNHYSWKKVTTTVHNIIVGKLWIDQVHSKLNNITNYLAILCINDRYGFRLYLLIVLLGLSF